MRWWPFRKKRPTNMEWARAVVDTIPRAQLADHAITFAEQARRTREPAVQAQHWAKFIATMERIGREVEDHVPSDELIRAAADVFEFAKARRVTFYGAADAFSEKLQRLKDALP